MRKLTIEFVRRHFDIEWHTAWYQAILNKRYGYVYEEITNAQ